jgi:phage terminase small subunit
MSKKLTDKQERFCLEYVIDFNATQAAIRAGYSESTAKEQGCQHLTKLNIQERIQKLKAKAVEKIEITHSELLQELKNWAYSDITETMELSASQVKELPIEIRRLVTKFKRTTRSIGESITEDVIELHFVSKEKAIELIAKHIGFFEKDNEQKKTEFDMSGLTTEELIKRAEAVKKLKD